MFPNLIFWVAVWTVTAVADDSALCEALTRAFSVELYICAATLGDVRLKSFGKPSL